ncbi:tryptophan synthase subunit alpha [soil metagenome]
MTTTAASALTDTRTTRLFAETGKAERAAIMPYMPVGWPELDDTERAVAALVRGGADLIEIGMPFSDPIADGPTVQRVTQRALRNGVTTEIALDHIRGLRQNQGLEVPLIAMGYYNPILAYGIERFARDAREAGADGFIVPDLPPEESDELLAACVDNGLHLVYMLAPTSTEERFEAILERASGFIYLVSVVGITGARDRLWEGLPDYVARVRRHTSLPLALGFGISSHAQVVEAEGLVDGVIFASAMLNHLEQCSSEHLPAEIERYMRTLLGRD